MVAAYRPPCARCHTLGLMLACTCWLGMGLIAVGVIVAVFGLGFWRHRRTQRRDATGV